MKYVKNGKIPEEKDDIILLVDDLKVIAGPFSKTANDNVYIFVTSEYFSNFAEIFPIPNMEAKTIANVYFRAGLKDTDAHTISQ